VIKNFPPVMRTWASKGSLACLKYLWKKVQPDEEVYSNGFALEAHDKIADNIKLLVLS
jgi:hypothetical protein